METINTGGSAFPVVAENGLGHVSYGMDLRDYFATGALHGLLAAGLYDTKGAARCAEEAFSIADAMIAARGA